MRELQSPYGDRALLIFAVGSNHARLLHARDNCDLVKFADDTLYGHGVRDIAGGDIHDVKTATSRDVMFLESLLNCYGYTL